LVAWCGDPRRYAVLWLAFVGLLFGGAHQIVQEIKQGDAERADLQAYHRAVRDTLFDACWNRAGQSFREEAGTGDVTLRPRMMSYCTCLDIEVEKSYTPEQFAAVPKERWWARGDDKIERIMQTCRIEDSSFVRAALIIRKNGGNPDSEAMQPKILAYTACIKAELAGSTRRRPLWGSRRIARGRTATTNSARSSPAAQNTRSFSHYAAPIHPLRGRLAEKSLHSKTLPHSHAAAPFLARGPLRDNERRFESHLPGQVVEIGRGRHHRFVDLGELRLRAAPLNAHGVAQAVIAVRHGRIDPEKAPEIDLSLGLDREALERNSAYRALRHVADRHAGIERGNQVFLRVGEAIRAAELQWLVDIDREGAPHELPADAEAFHFRAAARLTLPRRGDPPFRLAVRGIASDMPDQRE
jgi:hypothetical protein